MDDKFKKDFIEIFEQQFEQKFITWFNKGFEEVVMPQIESLREEIITNFAIKTDLNTLEDRLNTRLDRVENKLDRAIDQLMVHGNKIKKLESSTAAWQIQQSVIIDNLLVN